jgi:hypothetical protein
MFYLNPTVRSRTEAVVQSFFFFIPLFCLLRKSLFAYKQPIGALMILSELATRAQIKIIGP